jgi:hypothetical protein
MLYGPNDDHHPSPREGIAILTEKDLLGIPT